MTTFQAEPTAGGDDGHGIVLSGDLDLASAQTFVDIATDAAAGARVLRLDLREVTFMDSTGLGALIKVRNLMIDQGGSVVLASVSPAVERVLELTGMSDVFPVG